MSVMVKIKQVPPTHRGHVIGSPGQQIRIPEGLARAMVKRGVAEYIDDAQVQAEEAEHQDTEPVPKPEKKSGKRSKKAEK